MERNRLIRVFQIDDLGHEAGAVDGVVEVILIEDDADRVFAGVDALRAVQVADDLDDGIKLGGPGVPGCR